MWFFKKECTHEGQEGKEAAEQSCGKQTDKSKWGWILAWKWENWEASRAILLNLQKAQELVVSRTSGSTVEGGAKNVSTGWKSIK